MTIPDAAIEATAEALWTLDAEGEGTRWPLWNDLWLDEHNKREPYRADARAVIEAAMPALERHYRQAIERETWKVVIECVERQADLPSLVHFDNPSDYRKGVLTVLTALKAELAAAVRGTP